MKRLFLFFLMALFIVCGGCAHGRPKHGQAQSYEVLAQKFELAKKENTDLKKELTLYRNSKHLDARQFVQGADVFEKTLADDIAAGRIGLKVSDRGLVITIASENLFVSGSATLSDEGKAFLDKIFDVAAGHFPENYIYVEGHTDNQSLAVFEWKSDWDFSFARALAVVEYLKEKGVDPLRLSAAGFGQYRPVASNETKEGRRLNRRIEVIISPQKVGHVVE
jgi:chemotaxis protein MotB